MISFKEFLEKYPEVKELDPFEQRERYNYFNGIFANGEREQTDSNN